MRDQFLKLCGDDPVCNANIASWKTHFDNWTTPSDSGMCIMLTSGQQVFVDKDNPYPGGIKWTDMANKAIILPAKISWAPLQTYIENNCHQSQNCGKDIGNWQQTVQSLNEQLK